LKSVIVPSVQSPPSMLKLHDFCNRATDRINRSGADIVWVGLSTPKQERWMAAHMGRLQAPALLGVGAAFDFHAGMVSQAPPWIQERGLEWLYRLGKEPRRLWKRYLQNNPAFVAQIIRKPPRLSG
ncbi:WecB/TagA/CpsF family glycosyltransferase, partial [Mycolicibacterium iranicum]|uniref:WecB/TagA/CpsF family glycosyltransferase n=1 Tax=Mycolicibacterium iranicum TaxID=912594 RepID=UPI00105476D1